MVSLPSNTKSQVCWRPNQARSKFKRAVWPRWLPSRKISSSMLGRFEGTASSIIKRCENVYRGQSEHGSGAHDMKGEPAPHGALQQDFGVHFVHSQSVFYSALVSQMFLALEIVQLPGVFLLESGQLVGHRGSTAVKVKHASPGRSFVHKTALDGGAELRRSAA